MRLTSRFKGIPQGVLDEIRNSPEFQRADFQNLLTDQQMKLHIGKNDIVTSGTTPDIYVVEGFIKAALVKLGLRGSAIVPQTETLPERGDLFPYYSESVN